MVRLGPWCTLLTVWVDVCADLRVGRWCNSHLHHHHQNHLQCTLLTVWVDMCADLRVERKWDTLGQELVLPFLQNMHPLPNVRAQFSDDKVSNLENSDNHNRRRMVTRIFRSMLTHCQFSWCCWIPLWEADTMLGLGVLGANLPLSLYLSFSLSLSLSLSLLLSLPL